VAPPPPPSTKPILSLGSGGNQARQFRHAHSLFERRLQLCVACLRLRLCLLLLLRLSNAALASAGHHARNRADSGALACVARDGADGCAASREAISDALSIAACIIHDLDLCAFIAALVWQMCGPAEDLCAGATISKNRMTRRGSKWVFACAFSIVSPKRRR
jgi:hypothetical protein